MRPRISGAGVMLLLIACAGIAQARADIRASLDASQVAVGDTVQLTLEHDGSTGGQPDLTPLQHDFDILGTSSNTSIELRNGAASERTEVVLTLAPKTTGRVTIPPLVWDGQRTQALSLVVTGPGGTGQPGGVAASPVSNVFIETSVSAEQPYVQAAVQLTVRLFTSSVLYRADLELPENGDVVAKQIGTDENSDAQRNGRTYQVITRHYVLFPLHSGRLTLQGPVLDAEIASNQPRRPLGSDPFGGGFFGGPFFQTVRPVRLHGKPIELTVRARPASAIGSYWLPARNVTLSDYWTPAKLSAPAGDPITVDLSLQATGLTAAQLPDLSPLLGIPPGLKAYPDQPKLNDSTQNGLLVGSREQTIALMADTPGHYTIPALTVTWWDTQTNRPRVTTVPARTLTILPAAGSATATASAAPVHAAQPPPTPAASQQARQAPAAQKLTPPRSPSRWQWISIALAIVWLTTLGAWLWSRRSRRPRSRMPPPSPPHAADSSGARRAHAEPSRERTAFRIACETNDAHAARAHLMAWAGALWGTMPAGVNAIAARIGDPAVAELLRDLDRACYAGGAWQGHALAAALTELPTSQDKNARERNRLAPLYP